MSEAAITVILSQVTTILEQQIRREVRLISGVEKQVKKLKSEFESLKAVLVDAEKRQVKEETVRVWFDKLKDVSYDTDDVLFEWITLMRKAEAEEGLQNQPSPTRQVFSIITLPCLGLNRVALRRDIAIKIKNINERLDDIANERYKYSFNLSTGDERIDSRHKSTSFIDVSEVEGRDLDKNTLISKLLSDKKRGLNVVSIVGLGGIGKTTLAQVVYNSAAVIHHFDRRIWVCVSEPFEEVRVAKAIIEDMDDKAPELFELETLARRIRDRVRGTKFLLVLDDVWTEDIRKWDPILSSLKTGAAGSAILVTTRNNRVGAVMGCNYELRLGKLSDHDSWSLFKKIAFFERKTEEFEVLENVGKQIADKCKGLPLTIKTIASLMRFKSSINDWLNVLNSEFWEFKKEVEGLFPPLMLSYYDLSSVEKRCFSYCAVFPKDHVIESSNLIQLWMAQGYLSSADENVEMEVIGQEYLQNLAMRSFFQDLVKDKSGNKILSFKIHDIVHDFAQYLTKNECSVVEFSNDYKRKMESSNTKPRHLTVVRSDDIAFPDIPNVDKLFTLWVQSFHDSPPIISQVDAIEPDLFHRVKCVRALDLSRNRVGELPNEVGNLIKLKYLNLSHNPLGELPSTLSELYNLQTLKLSACNHLTKLPPGIGKLANLRHLEIDRTDSLKTLPKGIGKLKSLQTLNKFIVSKNRGDEACVLEDLSNLNNLRGRLEIEGLGYVAGADEAKTAHLKKKIHLSDVEMDFGNSSTQTRSSQDEVIEGLELHENVQSLVISSFSGTKLPNWMMRLINLQKLLIQDCQNCSNLPPLGKLPSLVTLHLEGMNAITCIGLDFLGMSTINGQDGSESSSLSSSSFPKLKKLKISKMERWEEWEVIRQDRCMEIMPRLRCLKISGCNKLKALPSLLLQNAPLGKLRVDECLLLKQSYKKGSGEDWSKISHISKVRVS